MFHDPTLDRTTTGKGLIRKQPWQDVIEHVRTKAEPIQPIPLFEELVALLTEPGHRHVSLNIDCKMQNDPEMLFPEMARIIAMYPGWETELAPRLILGLWHPLFLRAAYKYLPLLRRYHIGFSPAVVERYFWDACDGFSLNFALLMGSEGQAFLKKCREAGKEICLWTVNDPGEMRVAMSWGVKAILTDRVGAFTSLRKEIAEEPEKLELTGLSRWTFPWSHWRYYSVAHVCANRLAPLFLSAHGALPNSTSYPTRNEPTAAYNHNLPHTTIDAMSTPGDFDTTNPPPSDLDQHDPPMSSPLSDRVASYLPGG